MHKGLRYTPVRASRCAPTLLSRVTVSLVTILFQSMFRAHMGLLSVSVCIVKRCQNALEVFAVSRGWWPGTLWRDPKLGCTHAQCILGSRQNAQGSPVHPGTCFKMCTHVIVTLSVVLLRNCRLYRNMFRAQISPVKFAQAAGIVIQHRRKTRHNSWTTMTCKWLQHKAAVVRIARAHGVERLGHTDRQRRRAAQMLQVWEQHALEARARRFLPVLFLLTQLSKACACARLPEVYNLWKLAEAQLQP